MKRVMMSRTAVAAVQKRCVGLQAIDPYTGKLAWEMERWSAEEGIAGLQRANDVQPEWARLPLEKREALLREASKILRENAKEYAKIIAVEMGKPIAQGEGEVLKCATITDYYADEMHALLQDDHVDLPGAKSSYVTKQPLGTVLLIMPWNFPFWQVFRQASAALSAGNVIVCKHAPNVPKCAVLIQDVFHQAADAAGVPLNVYVNLPMFADDIKGIMGHRSVRAVSLTGSSTAGMAVGAASAKLLKPSVLELGGSDPSLVLADADVERAAHCAAMGRMLNAGQSCIGSKRFVVVEAVYDRFLEAFVEEMQKFQIGDPKEAETNLGTLVDHKAQKQLHEQATATIAGGAKVALAGGIPDHPGAFYLPTVLSEVPPGTPGYDDEMFGPVASVIKVKDEAEAIAVANSSRFGLGASIYTADIERGNQIAREEIDAGMCFVNDFVKSSPLLPFGGVKESGYGRECGSYGITAFCNIKTVVVA